MDTKDSLLKNAIVVKSRINQSIKEGKFEDAKNVIAQYEQIIPNDPEISSFKVNICLKKKNLDKAKEFALEGTRKHPQNFETSFTLALVFEEKEEYLYAYNSYRNAEYFIDDKTQEKKIKVAINRLKQKFIENVYMKIKYYENGYSLLIKAKEETITLTYKLDELRLNKSFLELILAQINHDSTTVLEIECKEGILSRTLSDIGFEVVAVDSNDSTRLKWIGMECGSKIRDLEIGSAKYVQADFDMERVKGLSNYFDVIILFPKTFEFYKKMTIEENIQYIKTLAKKANKQFFFSVPMVKETEQRDKYENLVDAIKTIKNIDGKAVLDITDKINVEHQIFKVNSIENKDYTTNIIPTGLDVEDTKSTIFEVSLDRCVDLNGFHYIDDWQHFITLLNEYKQNPELKYEDSILKKYYDVFCPRNLEEQYFFEDGKGIRNPLNKGWGIYPWFNLKKNIKIKKSRIETRPGGSHHFGPNTDDFGKDEFKRITQMYDLLKVTPYEPEIYMDGYPQGNLLKDGDEYRFVAKEGQHRIPALVLLGYEKIRCKKAIREIESSVIDIKDIKKWPQVKNGLFSRSLAEKLFYKFFEKRGQVIAKELKLI